MVVNTFAYADGLTDDEKLSLQKSILTFAKIAGTEMIKQALSDAVANELNKIVTDDSTLDIVKKNTKFFTEASKTVTKSIGIIFTLGTNILSGISKYKSTLKIYTADGIPEDIAKHDAFIDAITVVIHGLASYYTKGIDDLIFNSIRSICSWVTGIEVGNYHKDKNYTEVVSDLFKAFNYTNTGTDDANTLVSDVNNTMIYGKGGNDSIINVASRVTVYGGTGNDTISSKVYVVNNSTPQNNSIIAGSGDDFIFGYEMNSSIYGNEGDDKILIINSGNRIEGGDGIDGIWFMKGANKSTVNGGKDNDGIILEDAKNIVIEYSTGDGNDLVYGYDESDTIKISGSYSTQLSGQDFIINVGGSLITLKDAANKIVNINGNQFNTDTVSTSTPIYITLPSFWYKNATQIKGTDKDDTINNSLDNMIINALAGNDTIANSGGCVTVIGGAGNDFIRNYYGANVTINGGDGDDTLYNYYGTNSYLDGGAGNNDISNYASDVSISGNAGNDSIVNSAGNVLIDSGNGNDSIYNYDNGHDVTIRSGIGNDSITNRKSNVIIDGGEDGDYITNDLNGYISNVSIYGNAGNDTIFNIPLNGYYGTENESGAITLNGGDGDDSIYSSGYNIADVTTKNQNIGVIKGGAGNDSIYYDRFNTYTGEINYLGAVSIEGNDGKDLISIRGGGFATISAGNGNDKIYVDSIFTSINAGNGNDTIHIDGSCGSQTYFKYALGDGNDVVYLPSTKAHSTFVTVIGGICNRIISGNDIIVSVGEESITFKDAIDKSISVSGENVSGTVSLLGTEGDDDFYRHPGIYVKSETGYDSYDGTVIYVNGLDGNDQISHTVNSATLLGDIGNDTIYNDGSRALIDGGIGEDKLSNSGSNATIYGNDGNDSISNSGSNALVNGGIGNDTISNGDIDWRRYDENVTINGEDGDDLITNVCHNVTIYGGKGNDSIYNNYNSDNIYIDGGEGNNLISLNPHDTRSIETTINVSDGTNKIEINSSEFKQFNTFMRLNIEGFGVDDVITFSDAITSLNGSGNSLVAVVNEIPVTIEGLTFSSTAAHFSGLTFKSASSSEGYSLSSDKKSISYSPAVTETDLFALTNVKNTDSITVNQSNKTVTLSTNNLTGKNVSITGDYSLKLGNDVSTSTTKTAGSFTKFKSGTATFKTTAYSDFYSLKNNKVIYTAASGGKAISIKNLKSSATLDALKSGITITEQKNGSCKITFKNADVLTSKAPTISATDVTYTVALDKSLKPSAIAPDWKVSGTNASLKSDTSAGYTVSDNKVLYSKKVTGSPQLVLGGLFKNSSLSAPVKKVVTLDSRVLGKNTSLKSNDGSYTVKLTGNMSKKTFTGSANADSLNIAANNATVLGGAGNDSFTVSGSKVTLTGGKGNDSFKLSGKNPVLIYNTGDGNDTVNFVAGMQISLSGSTQIKTLGKSGSDLLLGFGKNSSVKITGAKSTDTLKVSDASGSVTLVAGKFDLANSLTFNSKNSSVTVAKNFTGSLAPSDDIYLGGSKLSGVATINAGNVTSEISISGNAKANFISAGKNNDSILGGNGNDSIAGNAGNDKLYGQNGNDTLRGGSGNDTLTGGAGKDLFFYSAGNDVITDYAAGDKISIGAAITDTTVSGNNVVFSVGSGSLTIKDGKGKKLALIDSAGKSSTATITDVMTVTNSTKSPVTAKPYTKTIDASSRTKAVKIVGNALANTISGGAGNDMLTGGAGKDLFFYSAGNDVITDYAAGDKISIGAAITDTTVSGNNVVFSVGSGSLTIKDGKGKKLALIDSTGKSSTATITDVMTVSNSTKSPVTVKPYTKTIDASKRTKAVKITGNALANSIVGGTKADSLVGLAGNDTLRGGSGNDTLTGGKGNDSLWGDAGKDTFIYSSGDGKDVIFGFESGDLLQITGAFSASYNKSAKSVAFKVDSTASAITLKDFGSTTIFHVNSSTYQLSGGKLTKK